MEKNAEARQLSARWSSFHTLALLLALIAILLLLTVMMAFREPSYSMAIDSMSCLRLDPANRRPIGEQRISLPFSERPGDVEQRRAIRCSFELSLTDENVRNVALLIPSYADTVTVTVNGQTLAASTLHMMRNLRIASLPAFLPSLDDALIIGLNRFEITVSALPSHVISLDRIFIGNPTELRSYYHSKWLLLAITPTVVVGSELALAIVFGLIWMARRHEHEFGWLATTLVLAAARGTIIIPDFGLADIDRPFWNILVLWEALTGFLFCRALTHAPRGRRTGLLILPPLLFTGAYFFGPLDRIMPIMMAGAMVLVVFYLAASLWTLTHSSFQGDRDSLVVLPGVVILLAVVGHDIYVLLTSGASRIFLGRAVYGCFLLAVAALMTYRFIRAMGELDNVAIALNRRVAEVEEQLRGTYEELRVRREAEAIQRERIRLMRDLHDGIGGELTTMLALADAKKPSLMEIAQHARAALTDMRLIIGSLEDYGGDLSLALGSWRERAGPQLRIAGLHLIWHVEDVPILQGMGPSHVLDVLRIIQEAVNNVMKHARATTLWISVSRNGDGVRLAICDDGPRFNAGHKGNGISNMHSRAVRLGATLSISRCDNKTCVVLLLPRKLPALDIR